MKTLKDFLECDLFEDYDYVEICDDDDGQVLIPPMMIKELWQYFHDTKNYTADEFKLMHIYCEDDIYRGCITLHVRYESC